VIGGVGSVLVFLPQIVILFLFIICLLYSISNQLRSRLFKSSWWNR